MFWDKVSGVYDLFENIYNKSVYQSTGETVSKYIKILIECLSAHAEQVLLVFILHLNVINCLHRRNGAGFGNCKTHRGDS